MPLTSVVDYYNVRLPELHPQAHLRQGASYRLDHGILTAQIADFVLTPYLVPVVYAATGQVFGQRAKLLVRTAHGHCVPPESLYVHAWDAADVVFLDRFLRTFHALNHLHQGHDGRELLVLDVHLRHVAALPEHHGEVFETLLHRFGLRTDQVVLRLDGRALHTDPHVQEAARSFAGYGYRLLAARPDIGTTDWGLLGTLGVRWVVPHPRDLDTLHRSGTLAGWGRQAAVGRLGLWLDGVDTPQALARARTLGVELIEADLPPPVLGRAPLRHALTPSDVAG
ncbi:hypothetical protein [uncultured Thiodictyon sp.]|uniref:hypothetical protein n=1 Tax=uncultured Thiodictyon sp. TaxID=1846217 RepID=UPI0025E31096|nr:hypothetical protein [uncultured Thiodictyon sp.]